jgi:type IV secretory pathway VirB10-like protein
MMYRAVLSRQAYTSNLKRQIVVLSATFAAFLFLASCARRESSGQHATIVMRDGTTLMGTVTATSPAQITVAGDDNATHTVQTAQVKSIEYGDASAAQDSGAQPAPAAPQSSGTQPAAAPSRSSSASNAESDRTREHRYHPTREEIQTKTYVVPAGTKVSIRTEDTIDSSTAAEGQTYPAVVTDNVVDTNGDVVIPHGSDAKIVIRSASKGGRIRGASDLVLDLASI